MDIATLQLEIDSRKAAQAKRELEGLTTAAQKTEAATDSLSQATAQGEDRYQAIARAALERKAALDAEIRSQMQAGGETRKVTAEMQAQAQEYTRVASAEHQARLANERQAAAMKAAAEAAEQNQASLQRLMNQIDPLQGKLDRLDEMERQLTQSFRQGVVDLDSYGVALAKINGQRAEISDAQVKQVAAGAEQAASSMERLGIHTASARYDMMMLARAAATGDMRQASSSMLQLGTRTNLVGAAARAAINPFTLLAAAVAGVFLLYERGAREIRGYNIALIETGHIAGATSSEIAGMARRITEETGSISDVSAALTELVRMGGIAKEDLGAVGVAAVSMSKATGRSVSDMVSEFALLAKDPVRGIQELNNEYHYLSLATYEQIKALSEQGREQDAVSVAVRAHGDMMSERAPQIAAEIGIIANAWSGAKRAVSDYIGAAARAVSSIGAPRDAVTIRADLDAALQERDRAAAGIGRGLDAPIKWVQENIFGKQGEQLVDSGDLAYWEGQIRGFYSELADAEDRERKAAEQSRYQKIQDSAKIGSDFLSAAEVAADSELRKANAIAEVKRRTWEAVTGALSIPADEISEEERFGLVAKYEQQEAVALADIEKRYTDKTPKTRTRVDEGQRLLAQMNERLGLIDKETEYERTLFQIQSGRYQGLADWQKEAALDVAEQIDATNRQIETERTLRDIQSERDLAERKFFREMEAFGRGDQYRGLLESLSQIEEKYQRIMEQRRNSFGGLSTDEQQMWEAQRDAELEREQERYLQRIAMQQDWVSGASRALENYYDISQNVAGGVETVFSNAFKGMEDALTTFVTTGKGSFSDLADSIIRDMIRIAIQQSVTGPLAGMFGSMFSGPAAPAGVTPGVSWTFADGGYTGPGAKYEPAGIVHKGEGVLSQDEIRALGGEAGFNALRRAIRGPGHASGGLGGRPSLPPMPASAAGTGAVNVTVNVSRESGAQVNAPAGMEGVAREIGQFVEAKIREHEARSQRQGGVAWQARQGAF